MMQWTPQRDNLYIHRMMCLATDSLEEQCWTYLSFIYTGVAVATSWHQLQNFHWFLKFTKLGLAKMCTHAVYRMVIAQPKEHTHYTVVLNMYNENGTMFGTFQMSRCKQLNVYTQAFFDILINLYTNCIHWLQQSCFTLEVIILETQC